MVCRWHGAGTSSPSYWQQVEEQAPKPVGWMMCFLLMTFVLVQKLCVNIYIYLIIYTYAFPLIIVNPWSTIMLIIYCPQNYTGSDIGRIYTYNRSVVQFWWSCTPSHSIGLFISGNARFLIWMPIFVFFGLPMVSCSMKNRLILGCLRPLVFVLNNILILSIWRSAISHLLGCFLPLYLLSEYRIQHGPSDPFMSHIAAQLGYSAGGGACFATDCPCGVWGRESTSCPLHVGPPFGNRL